MLFLSFAWEALTAAQAAFQLVIVLSCLLIAEKTHVHYPAWSASELCKRKALVWYRFDILVVDTVRLLSPLLLLTLLTLPGGLTNHPRRINPGHHSSQLLPECGCLGQVHFSYVVFHGSEYS